MPRVARNAFDIGEVWNPACCHGNKIVKLKFNQSINQSTLFKNFGAHLVESYRKESNISDTNWLRYLLSSYLIKTWLSIGCYHLANLQIIKACISLKQKEIFENSKKHFSSHAGYLFMFLNGFNRKDVIFVIVAL